MRIDLNCPAEVVGVDLDQPEKGWIRLILMNLSDRVIDSCEATVRVKNREGTELGRTVHRARALRGRGHGTFPMLVPMELPEGAESAEATLDKVWFEDRDVWRRDPGKEREYEPNQLPPGNDLNALRFVAGSGAVGFPDQQTEMWICVCGRANGNAQTICARCRRQKEMIFQQYNRNAVLRQVNQRERQLDLQTRGAREEAAQLQRLREAEYEIRSRRRTRRKRLGIALAACLALGAACYFGAEPGLRLWSADTALREERLEDAREILTALGSFPGAQRRLTETEERIARRDGLRAAEDAGAFSVEQMEEIAASLRGTGEDSDAALADRVMLSAARARLSAGEPEAAEAILAALPEELAGRADLLRDCAFARGERALTERAYDAAVEIFTALGDYPGAAEKALEAAYESALQRMETGEYEEAIAAFANLGNYQDSADLILQCWYLKGLSLENQGETEAAYQAYLSAGEYEDAAERARDLHWRAAEAFYAAGEYEAALPLYRELDGMEDARAKWIACATELARAAYKQREYAIAASWLEDLPEDTRDTLQIRTRAYYLGAKAAATRGELAEAIAMMEHVPDYSDAQRNLRGWRIELAEQYLNEGRLDEAREVLAPVEDHYQAQRVRKAIEKQLQKLEEQSAEDGEP